MRAAHRPRSTVKPLPPLPPSRRRRSKLVARNARNMPGWASLRRVGTSPQTSLVGEINDAVAQYFVTMSLRNVCVVFYPEQRTQYRSQFVSREGVTAVLHGFSEYDLGYQRLTTVRPEQARDRQQLARCTTKQLAIAVPMSSNNLYHQAFHAVPAWETLRAHASENATLLPLVFPSAAFGRGKPASPRRWYVQPRASKVGRVWLARPLHDGGGLSPAPASPTVASAPRQRLGRPSAAPRQPVASPETAPRPPVGEILLAASISRRGSSPCGPCQTLLRARSLHRPGNCSARHAHASTVWRPTRQLSTLAPALRQHGCAPSAQQPCGTISSRTTWRHIRCAPLYYL